MHGADHDGVSCVSQWHRTVFFFSSLYALTEFVCIYVCMCGVINESMMHSVRYLQVTVYSPALE